MYVKKLLTMSPELWKKVQAWRFHQEIETSTEALRQLLERALKVEDPVGNNKGRDCQEEHSNHLNPRAG